MYKSIALLKDHQATRFLYSNANSNHDCSILQCGVYNPLQILDV